ncbi:MULTISPECIES: type II secretion system F family protein [Microbacterium]|uniref:Pilus assembly protein TadB n=1 Tax=Microbacterium wangchenii TaxID=2541726 RepID=A0ABX5T077_9MICO|nr:MULTISPECIES: type II secretion system F family protein [Microbacterium]MCK6067473.1 type II secretion system F family protein [Microbacterium sp. EYE_512]QBR90748.1 pilus assembly protein TadB [Microbacterium wangchenii]TXK16809.1 pilus assembly protein TadB [Microbacterium wangchenii]
MRRRRSARPDAAVAADTVLRLAVLLRAGLAPSRAWIVLDDGGDPVAGRVRAAVTRGEAVSDALAAEGGAWNDVAAAWTVATTVGAPLSESLRDVASALRDGQRTADDIRVALAEPASTARLLGWLPLVAVVLGLALGFDTALVLATTPIGLACLVGGVVLMVIAHRWNAALVRRAAAAPGIPGMAAELTAIALAGGASIDRARGLVRDATGDAAGADVDEVLALSRAAGVPAVELLRSSAWLTRHRARTDGRLRAARLSARLLLPLGVCTLPSFLLLGVAPMMLSILSSGVLTL